MDTKAISRAFGPSHPFWNEAVTLRQEQNSVVYITEVAAECGYPELKYSQIAYGLRHAPADLHLPVSTSKFLRRRYQEVTDSFNSYTSMRDLAQEAISKIAEIEEDLSDPDLTMSRRTWLEGKLWQWYQRAFDWSRSCSDIDIRMGEIKMGIEVPVQQQQKGPTVEEIKAATAKIAKDFTKKIPSIPTNIVEAYGEANVKPAGRIDDGLSITEDDEEL